MCLLAVVDDGGFQLLDGPKATALHLPHLWQLLAHPNVTHTTACATCRVAGFANQDARVWSSDAVRCLAFVCELVVVGWAQTPQMCSPLDSVTKQVCDARHLCALHNLHRHKPASAPHPLEGGDKGSNKLGGKAEGYPGVERLLDAKDASTGSVYPPTLAGCGVWQYASTSSDTSACSVRQGHGGGCCCCSSACCYSVCWADDTHKAQAF